MSRTCPYLQRRGESYFFRIHVPMALRRIVGTREITKSLGTRDRRVAQPVALQLGSIATRLFHDLQAPGMSNEETLRLLEQARQQLSIREISRRTGMARNTVKKYLRSDETEPTYAKRAVQASSIPMLRS